MRFTDEGEIAGKELVTGPEVSIYRDLRQLALSNSAAEAAVSA
jgi:hypothetical protein